MNWYDSASAMLILTAAFVYLAMLGITAIIRARPAYKAAKCAAGEHRWRRVGRSGGQRRSQCRDCPAIRVSSCTYTVVDEPALPDALKR